MENRKVLFVLTMVGAGGSATSLLNLLQLYKEQGITYDLFLLVHDGVFLQRAKEVANLLPEEPLIAAVTCQKELLHDRPFKYFLLRCCFVLAHKLFGSEKVMEFVRKRSAKELSGKYHTVVAYQEETTTEYVQYIQDAKKVAWVHNDYCRFAVGKTKEYTQRIYDKFNEIVCVSQASKNSMLENLKLLEKNVHLVYNTIIGSYIREQSKAKVESLLKRQYTFVSMGRFAKQKRFDRAVEVAAKLKNEGIDFIWYIIGQGEDFAEIKKQIEDNNLEKHLILLGLKANPFPYIKQADCFVLTSVYEAQPMVLNEALTLGIPVISTSFTSAKEVVDDGVNGLIVPNSAEGVYKGVLKIIKDKNLFEKIKAGAQNFEYDNIKILEQVSEVIS